MEVAMQPDIGVTKAVLELTFPMLLMTAADWYLGWAQHQVHTLIVITMWT